MANTLEIMLLDLEEKKKRLDAHRPLPQKVKENLYQWFKVECTYSSNALEGNTLTSSETALVLEKWITIGGKSLREHLEAINHGFSFDFINTLVGNAKNDISLQILLNLHRLVLRVIDDKSAGRLRTIPVKIAGSTVELPSPAKVPDLMHDFIKWLHAASGNPMLIAADAHYKLVAIHPFVDGNGRTARLLMNLLLMQSGYPPALIMPQERKAYLDGLAAADRGESMNEYYEVILSGLDRSLNMYLEHLA